MRYFFSTFPKILVLFGSVRSGKTYILIVMFLILIALNKNRKKLYLITGNTKASIWRNVIMDMEKILGRQITLDKASCFDLLGNKILVVDGGQKGCAEKLRGTTLSGVFGNELTTLQDDFIQECQNRLSDDSLNNGWFLGDTNPDSLQSYTYKNFVMKDESKLSSGRTSVKCFKFTIWDNPFITHDYVENLVATTPDGHIFERMINGEWCNSTGAVWKDFDVNKHVIEDVTDHYNTWEDFEDDIDYFIGSYDVGYEHYGVALLVVKTYSQKYYVLDSVIEKRKQFDFYGDKILQWKEQYGKFTVYFDWARPDAGAYLEDMGIDMEKANKSVIEGITTVSSLLKQDRLYFLDKAIQKKGLEQMINYEWQISRAGDIKDVPKKMNDDFCDALRYAIHSDIMNNIDSNRLIVPQFGNFLG
ncbi:MAG: PBSX family phage terminase large subunit [Peptostreptococcaceae bacterium]